MGGAALRVLVTRPQVSAITLLNRRRLALEAGEHVVQHIVDVFDANSYHSLLEGHDTVICTFGVGEPSKVARDEFLRVDKQAVLDFAVVCKNAGVRHFSLLASVGADPASRSFYLRSKGELRDAIRALGFERFSVFQPSVILTPTNRYGFSQGVLLKVWPILSPLLVGGLRKYRGIAFDELGRAIANNAVTPGTGFEILQWEDIHGLGAGA